MDVSVNKFLGKKPRESDTLINIYSFRVNNHTYIEFIDMNYLVWNIVPIFYEKMMDEIMSKYSPSSRNGVLRDDISRSFQLKGAIHLVFNKRSKKIVITEENGEPKKKNKGSEQYSVAVDLIQKTAYWISENPKFVGEDDVSGLSVSSNSSYWSHQNYALYSIEDFPKVVELIEDYENSPFFKCSILSVDYSDEKLMSNLKEKIGSSFQFQDPYLTQKNLQIDGAEIEPPTIIINMRGKSEFRIERDLYSFISEGSGESLTDRNRKILERQVALGYSLEDMYYFHFGGINRRSLVSGVAKNFDKEASDSEKEDVEKSIKDLRIDPNDKATSNFVKAFWSYKNVFPIVRNDGSKNPKYNKKFYYVVSIDKSQSAPSDPATRNHELFLDDGNKNPDSVSRGLFKVISSKSSSKKIYYLLSSDYCFPKSVFDLFVQKENVQYPLQIELHNIFEFNETSGILSSYPFVENKIDSSEENTFYNAGVLVDFPEKIKEELGDKLKDNRFNDKVIIKTISEFPLVHEKVSKWFSEAQIPYRDLNVIFIYDISPQGYSKLGGYTSKNLANAEVISLVSDMRGSRKLSSFKLPVILLNIAHKKLQIRENLSLILIHECRHFFDDILVEMGKKDKDFMQYPEEYNSLSDPDKKTRVYLKTPVEINAFKEEIIAILERYNLEYVKRNYTGIKNRVIHNYIMGAPEGRKGIADEFKNNQINQSAIDLYGEIFDQAFLEYEAENFPAQLETKN